LTRAHRSIVVPWILPALLFLAGTGISGCGSIHKDMTPTPTPRAETPSIDPDLKSWEEALQAFHREDYNKAAESFTLLGKNSANQALALNALYALACTRLIVAQTPEEFSDALSLWDAWSRKAPIPNPLASEDPRLLTPFLERVTPPCSSEPNAPKKDKPKKKAVCNKENNNQARDLTMTRNQLQTREKEMAKIKARLDAREKEIRRLKHQIDSLEAIHLKIQEKQKEVSSP